MNYYYKISAEDFRGYRQSGFLDFSDSEILRLRLIPELKNIGQEVSKRYLQKGDLYIYKLPDEWYILYEYDMLGGVPRDHRFGSAQELYKCDQMEGLIKCLLVKL